MALVVGLSLVLMTLEMHTANFWQVRRFLSAGIAPLQYLVDFPSRVFHSTTETVRTQRMLLQENANLKHQQLLLNVQLQKLASLQAENERLRTLLHALPPSSERVLVANLLTVDNDPFSHQVIVDKGAKDDVFVGQPVLDAYGVLGQVIRVGQMTSTILLITDSSHALPVQNNRSGSRAIGVGTHAFNQLELANVTNNADIKIGDLMITSGLGGRFPAGYPVGLVERVKRDRSQPFAHVTVSPSAHIDSAREVLLVWPGKMTVANNQPINPVAPPSTSATRPADPVAQPATGAEVKHATS